MKRTLILLALLLCYLALTASSCDDTYQINGEYTDDHNVRRVFGQDTRDGAAVSIPKAQVPGVIEAGDCVQGGIIYKKAECPK